MMDKKKILRNDLILIISLLIVAAVALILTVTLSKRENLTAKIIVKNEVVEVIDLSLKEERDYIIDGVNGKLKVHTHDGGIAVTESNCPHQDCVNMGYVYQSNRPIICAYNAVYIVIEGASSSDVII